MTSSIRIVKNKFLNFIPLLLLFFISLNGSSVIDFNLISVSIHFIIVYYWILKKPETIGYGFVFLSGIITDVIFGLPIGITALTLLIVASVAAYVRVVTLRISLISDWLVFIPALLSANIIYFFVLYISGYSIDFIYLLKNSIFTFIFYPIFWVLFEILRRISKQ
jgi:rod shape-determining protein MreD